MRARPVLVPFVAALFAAPPGGCSAQGNPYEALTSEALRYVIPGSEDWTSGELCPDGGDCSGPITVAVIESYDWYRITDLILPQDVSTAGTVTATVSVDEARPATDAGAESVRVELWGPDAEDVRMVLADGFEIWTGVAGETDHAVVFAAFDADGRLAGIGNAAADYFTVPVAELAADADAHSGFEYLDPIMSR